MTFTKTPTQCSWVNIRMVTKEGTCGEISIFACGPRELMFKENVQGFNENTGVVGYCNMLPGELVGADIIAMFTTV